MELYKVGVTIISIFSDGEPAALKVEVKGASGWQSEMGAQVEVSSGRDDFKQHLVLSDVSPGCTLKSPGNL